MEEPSSIRESTPAAAYPETTTTQSASIGVAELAQLLRINVPDDPDLPRVRFPTRRVHAGDALVRAGDRFHSLFVVRRGTLKTVALNPSGGEQVLAFPMRSDVIGLDGLDARRYAYDVIALEDSDVVVVLFARLALLARQSAEMESLVYRTLSRVAIRDEDHLCMLGSLGAEARVAAFLLNFAERLGAIGYSRRSFILRMTRQEIGSYLGIKLETVSRALSAFDLAGWIRVRQKQIDILDPEGLRGTLDEPRRGAATFEQHCGRSAARAIGRAGHHPATLAA